MEDDIKNKVRSFTDLNAWKEGHALVLKIYKLTENFPKNEQFGLTNQIRRSAISVTSNISEGFSRRSQKEKIQFYFMSLGSLTESQNQILISRDVGYLKENDFKDLADQTIVVSKLINGLIKKINSLNT